MPPMKPNHDDDEIQIQSGGLADQLSRGFQATQTLFTGLLAETREKGEAIAELRVDLKLLRREVENMLKIVRDGNGQKPLIVRMASVESCLDDMETKINQIEAAKEVSRGHAVAIVVAVISLFASVGVPVVQYLLGD